MRRHQVPLFLGRGRGDHKAPDRLGDLRPRLPLFNELLHLGHCRRGQFACALAAFGAAPYIFPEKRIHLQYTTTSPKLHKVLGVESIVGMTMTIRTIAQCVPGENFAVQREPADARLLAATADAGAQLALARLYETGTGVEQDTSLALWLYLRAAESGEFTQAGIESYGRADTEAADAEAAVAGACDVRATREAYELDPPEKAEKKS